MLWGHFAPKNHNAYDTSCYLALFANIVIENTGMESLTAIDCDSGKILWRSETAFAGYPFPAGEFYIAGGKALDVRNGEVKWAKQEWVDWENNYCIKNGVESQDRVFVSKSPAANSGFIGVVCVDPATGKDLWTYDTPPVLSCGEEAAEMPIRGPVVADGVVYFGCISGESWDAPANIIVLDPESGEVICKVKSEIFGEMATDGKNLYVYDKKYLYKLQLVR